MKNSLDKSPSTITKYHPQIPSLAGAIQKVNFLRQNHQSEAMKTGSFPQDAQITPLVHKEQLIFDNSCGQNYSPPMIGMSIGGSTAISVASKAVGNNIAEFQTQTSQQSRLCVKPNKKLGLVGHKRKSSEQNSFQSEPLEKKKILQSRCGGYNYPIDTINSHASNSSNQHFTQPDTIKSHNQRILEMAEAEQQEEQEELLYTYQREELSRQINEFAPPNLRRKTLAPKNTPLSLSKISRASIAAMESQYQRRMSLLNSNGLLSRNRGSIVPGLDNEKLFSNKSTTKKYLSQSLSKNKRNEKILGFKDLASRKLSFGDCLKISSSQNQSEPQFRSPIKRSTSSRLNSLKKPQISAVQQQEQDRRRMSVYKSHLTSCNAGMSTEERELAQIRNRPAFKARPLNRDMLYGTLADRCKNMSLNQSNNTLGKELDDKKSLVDISGFKKRKLTNPIRPNLSTEDRRKTIAPGDQLRRMPTQELEFQRHCVGEKFKARQLNKSIFQYPVREIAEAQPKLGFCTQKIRIRLNLPTQSRVRDLKKDKHVQNIKDIRQLIRLLLLGRQCSGQADVQGQTYAGLQSIASIFFRQKLFFKCYTSSRQQS